MSPSLLMQPKTVKLSGGYQRLGIRENVEILVKRYNFQVQRSSKFFDTHYTAQYIYGIYLKIAKGKSQMFSPQK